jgi:hypothetical protein
MPPLPDSLGRAERLPPGTVVAVGHVITVLLGPTTRSYNPKLHFSELINSSTRERIRVDLRSDDAWLLLLLLLGAMRLTCSKSRKADSWRMPASARVLMYEKASRTSELSVWE